MLIFFYNFIKILLNLKFEKSFFFFVVGLGFFFFLFIELEILDFFSMKGNRKLILMGSIHYTCALGMNGISPFFSGFQEEFTGRTYFLGV